MTPYLVTTAGQGSMDRCGRELARRLPVPAIEVEPRGLSTDFGIGDLSPAAARGALGDRRLLRRLRGIEGVPHFLHHHFARYGPALGRPYLVTAHDLIRYSDLTADQPLISRPNRRDRRWILAEADGVRRAAAVVAVSETTRADLLRRLGLDPDRVSVVPHGLDHAVFRPVPRRMSDAPYLLFVGSEHPRKNLPVLLQVFARLRRERPDLRLVKVGAPGSAEARFGEPTARAIRELGLTGAVDLVGTVSDEDLVAWYSGALCTVLPSRGEGFGLPALEAMACGCPVVVADSGSLPEVVDGAGPAVDPGDVTGWVATLAAVVDDGALRRRMRSAGLRRAAGFGWERAAAEMMRVYEGLGDRRVASSR